MWRSVRAYATHAVTRRPRRWRPLLAVYYLTYACPFRCPYCSDGAGTPYPRLGGARLAGADVLRLLATVRRHTDHLVLTGGEPLVHPDVDEVLRGLVALRFRTVVLTTNAHALDAHLEAVRGAVTHLVVSLDTLDAAKADAWFGAGPGTLARILANVEAARHGRPRRQRIVVSSVATPHNLPDLHAVFGYARARGFRFALCPQLQGVTPHPALAGDAEYRALYDTLIAGKRRGALVQGSPLYLAYMRDLRRFRCRPSTLLALSPTGDVFYPCLELGHVAGNLLETPDLHAHRAEGQRRFGPEPECGTQCHSACALGFALAFGHPLSALYEGWLTLKSAVRGTSGTASAIAK